MSAPSCTLAVRAVPQAPATLVTGWLGDSLKIRLHAPPVDGNANAELCRFLAEQLDLPRSAIRVATGAAARTKRVSIHGRTWDEVRQRLAPV